MAFDPIRRPTCVATINGTPVPLLSFDVENNNHFAADTWECTLALAGMPAGMGLAFWASQVPITVQLFAGLNGPPTTSLILGDADRVVIDAVPGEIHLSGRDKTAVFLEARTTAKFQDHFASDVITDLARHHGIKAQVTRTSTRIGQYAGNQSAKLSAGETEWTLMTYLAEHEGFDLFFSGDTLYFQPPAAPSAQPVLVSYSPSATGRMAAGNVLELQCDRSQHLASDVIVTVLSWNSWMEKTITGEARASKTGPGAGRGTPRTYTFQEPGLDWQQAQHLAEQKLREITDQERVIRWTEPANLTLKARSQVLLQGTGTAWDQLYVVSQVRRRMSFAEGFRMQVQANAASPQSISG
jgi:phage protein D